jgi:hypothetical protein
MIKVAHIPEKEALETARTVIRALGDGNELSKKWIQVASEFGFRYCPHRLPGMFVKPV